MHKTTEEGEPRADVSSLKITVPEDHCWTRVKPTLGMVEGILAPVRTREKGGGPKVWRAVDQGSRGQDGRGREGSISPAATGLTVGTDVGGSVTSCGCFLGCLCWTNSSRRTSFSQCEGRERVGDGVNILRAPCFG